MPLTVFPQPPELVVNWHITEACNYACRFCYAKWEDKGRAKELVHDLGAVKALISEVGHFFASDNDDNMLRQHMRWRSLRLNVAGGEPLLYGAKVLEMTALARAMEMQASIITNGSRLTPALMNEMAPQLSLLGLSLDAVNEPVNLAIGRADRHARTLSLAALSDVLQSGRRINPAMRTKINSVVNALNWEEDMSDVIRDLAPDKWKVLRMLPRVTDDLAVTDAQFQSFVERHQGVHAGMRVEDNSDMTESYIMIDPLGRFYQNHSEGQGYRYSDPILEVGAAHAFSQVHLSAAKFCSRYAV